MVNTRGYFFLDSVRCFSPWVTSCESTGRPFLRLTASMYILARFPLSAFSPKCRYSSSVEGTQKGSCSITWNVIRERENFFERYTPSLYAVLCVQLAPGPARVGAASRLHAAPLRKLHHHNTHTLLCTVTNIHTYCCYWFFSYSLFITDFFFSFSHLFFFFFFLFFILLTGHILFFTQKISDFFFYCKLLNVFRILIVNDS